MLACIPGGLVESVIYNEEDTGGQEMITRDEERVLRFVANFLLFVAKPEICHT